MSDIWPHASPESLCPICGKPDWCTFGDRAVLCRRVESNQPAAKGGWYHFYSETEYRPPTNLPKRPTPTRIFPAAMMESWLSKTSQRGKVVFAAILGVTTDSLTRLGVAWASEYRAWAFPMMDESETTIGIRLRNAEGFKWAVSGSRQGIFIPKQDPSEIVFLPEGPTDTAACVSLGLFAIGRPTCNSGTEFIQAYLKNHGIRKAVIVADQDDLKKVGNKFQRPGIEGAVRLKKELGIKSIIWRPPLPIKDMREYVKRGATRELIESSVRQKVWTVK